MNNLNASFASINFESDDECEDDYQQSLEGVAVFNCNEENNGDENENESNNDSENDNEDAIENISQNSFFIDEEWTNRITANPRWFYTENRKIPDSVLILNDPVEFFELFLNNRMMDLIIIETNRYGNEKNNNWSTLSENEFKKFLSICLLMGIMRLPTLRDYWSEKYFFGSEPVGSKFMSRNRFEDILGIFSLSQDIFLFA